MEGACGKVEIRGRLDYEAFKLPEDHPCVLAAEAAVRAVGGEPKRAISNGGLDANWLTARGIPTVSLGAGVSGAHTTQERLNLAQLRLACRVALRLATGRKAAVSGRPTLVLAKRLRVGYYGASGVAGSGRDGFRPFLEAARMVSLNSSEGRIWRVRY